jgi:hypothetical protein
MFIWKILEITSEAKSVHYYLSATDGKNTVETEGNHTFSDGLVNLPFDQIKETNLIDWLNTDTTKDGVNEIKLNLENQLKALESNQKVSFPWLADTFTPGS